VPNHVSTNEDTMLHPHHLPARAGLYAACLALLSGCASVAPDGGFDAVARVAQAHTGAQARVARDPAASRELQESVRQLLAAPLDMDGAVRVALLANPALQASYWEVGIAQADLVQATRLPNPGFDIKRLAAGGALEIERTLTFNLADLLTRPLAARLEKRRFEQVKLEIAARIERHALDTRRTWVEAVAAGQALEYARSVAAASEASAELAARMARAGNLSQLDLAREQLHQAEAGAALARAEREAARAREVLTRLLGLSGPGLGYTLPAHLPELPEQPAALPDVERVALAQRLDVQAAKLALDATAADLGLTRTTRFIDALDLAAVNRSTTGLPTAHGYELTVSVPLFDWGGARVAKAEAIYMAALQRVADSAAGARSEARDAWLGYRNAYDLARQYRDTVIPLRKRIGREVLLRYNGMLASPQELLADAREQAGAVSAYIDALKSFWLAQATLEGALGMRAADWPAGASAAAAPATAPAAEAAKEPVNEPAVHQHKEHMQ
jgi:outer membrane protein TolC